MNLTDLIGAVAQQAINGNQPQQQQNAGLGGLGAILGQLAGGQTQQNNNPMGGMLGSVLGSVLGGGQQQSGGNNALMMMVVPLILGWIQKQGGVQQAFASLTQAGLGSQVNSWLDTGANQQVSASQIQGLFDDQDVQDVANHANTDTGTVYSAIASALPQIIDQITPHGHADNANDNVQDVLSGIIGMLNK